jgi:uncharacterized protein (DUF983 family)
MSANDLEDLRNHPAYGFMETGEDGRHRRCPVCSCRVGRAALYFVREQEMCEGCGRDKINEWNEWVRKVDLPERFKRELVNGVERELEKS